MKLKTLVAIAAFTAISTAAMADTDFMGPPAPAVLEDYALVGAQPVDAAAGLKAKEFAAPAIVATPAVQPFDPPAVQPTAEQRRICRMGPGSYDVRTNYYAAVCVYTANNMGIGLAPAGSAVAAPTSDLLMQLWQSRADVK